MLLYFTLPDFLLFIPACFCELCMIFVKSIYSRTFVVSSDVTRTSKF